MNVTVAVFTLILGSISASIAEADEMKSVVGKWKPLKVCEGKLREHYVFKKDGTGTCLSLEANGTVGAEEPLKWKQDGDKVTIFLNQGSLSYEFELYEKGHRLKYAKEYGGVINHFTRE